MVAQKEIYEKKADYEAEIDKLNKQIEMEQKKQVETKVARAEKYAKKISGWCYYVLMVVLSLIGLLLVAIFGIRCWKEFVEGNAWWPYLVVEILGFIGVPSMLLAKKSPCHKWICRRRDKIYSHLYSCFLQHE